MKNQLIAIALVALLLPVFVIAEEPTTSTDTNADSAVTPADTTPAQLNIFEKIKLAFANSPEKKAQILLKYADKKQVKIEELYAQGKTKQAEQLQKKYDKYLELADKNIRDAENQGSDVSALVKEVDDVHEKHLQVLQLVKAKNPDAKGLDKAIANAQSNIEKQNAKKLEKAETEGNKDKVNEKSQGKGKNKE